jgi:hypothetical protein
MSGLDFNDAGEQRSLIPAGTIVTLQMSVRPGGAGDGGWLKQSANGASEGLDAEFLIVDNQYAKWKLWQLYTLHGTTPGHDEAGKISRSTLRAILESARGIKPDDTSEAAEAARKASSWGDFNGLRFIARLGVRPPQNGYPAKNIIFEVITPERQQWKKPEQVAQPSNGSAGATVTPPSTTPPANAIARPQWAG